jgi:esterase FrsA
MSRTIKFLFFVVAVSIVLAWPQGILAQQNLQGLTFEQFKERITNMAKRGSRPFTGIPFEDFQAFLKRFVRPDPELWGAEWMRLGEPYEKKGMELIAQGKTDEGRDTLLKAINYYFVGRFTIPTSPKKMESYKRLLRCYMAAAPYFDPPVQRISIPFKGKRGNELVGYLRVPKGEWKHPAVIFSGGLDGWKEERHGRSDTWLAYGFATFAIDLPGTGESPIYHSPEGHKVFSAAIDYLETRPEIDSKRLVFYGGSQGGYYGAKMAFVEKDRLRGSVCHGGPVHTSHTRAWQEKALKSSEYLMDFAISRFAAYGVNNLEDYYKASAALSLKTQGYIGKDSCPLLAINGKNDSQNSIEDVYILLEGGSNVRYAWVNPEGGHMGRSKKYSMDFIEKKLIIPFLLDKVR